MFTTKHANIFLIIWLFSFFGTSVAFAFFADTLPVAFIGAQALGALIPILAILAFFKGKRGNLRIRDIVPIKKPDTKLFWLTVLMGVLIQPLGMFVSGVSNLVGLDNAPIDTIAQMTGGVPVLAGFLMIAIVPSIFEELVCRGVFLSGYRLIDARKAAVINGIAFGIMHMNFRQFFYAFLLGCLITFLVIRSGNLLYAILIHFVINGTQFGLMQFAAGYEIPEYEAALPAEIIGAASVFGIAIAVVFILGFVGTFTWFYSRAYRSFAARCGELGTSLAEYDESAELAETSIRIHKPSLAAFLFIGTGFMVMLLL